MRPFIAVLKRFSDGRGVKVPRNPSGDVSWMHGTSCSNYASYFRVWGKHVTRFLNYGFTRSANELRYAHASLPAGPYLTSKRGYLSVPEASSSPMGMAEVAAESNLTLLATSESGGSADPLSVGKAVNKDKQTTKKKPKKAPAFTVADFRARSGTGCEPISMLTAYDYPSACIAQSAGVDAVLVGDSLGMVMMGKAGTEGVTMDEMVHHCKAVSAAADRMLVVGDMPFGSYLSPYDASCNAMRLVKEGGVHMVKLEGGERVADCIRSVVDAGIAVMAHIGLTPQSAAALGGFRLQGKTDKEMEQILRDARAVEAAGASAVVLEVVPDHVAAAVTSALSIPTIGIGAGNKCSGQILVWHDVLGLYHRPVPKFARKYAQLGDVAQRAITSYVGDVRSRSFPAQKHTFYGGRKRRAAEQAGKEITGQSCSVESLTPAPGASHVVVIGGGAMGSMLAARVRSCGAAVVMLSHDSEHCKTIQRSGCKLIDPDGNTSTQCFGAVSRASDAVQLIEDTIDGGSFVTVFLAVKGEEASQRAAVDARTILESLPGRDRSNSAVVSMQNGFSHLQAAQELAQDFTVLLGTTCEGATRTTAGTVEHRGHGKTVLLPTTTDERHCARVVLGTLLEAGFQDVGAEMNTEQPLSHRDMQLWRKVLINAAINPLTALTRRQNGVLVHSKQARNVARQVLEEGLQALELSGSPMPFASVDEAMDTVMQVAQNTHSNTSSMLTDVIRGRSTEVSGINGALVERGASCALNMHTNSLLSNLVSVMSTSTEIDATPGAPTKHGSSTGWWRERAGRLMTSVSEMRAMRAEVPHDAVVGFVPTMGALHSGHLSLMRRARDECDVVVASVFVNPTQFNAAEDLQGYPRDLDKDLELMRAGGFVDGVFAPSAQEMYGQRELSGSSTVTTRVVVPGFETRSEAAGRPGHFDGVSTVCCKLFNVVHPHCVYLGQKDYVQTQVVRTMVEELLLDVDVRVCDTHREENGLAMSSRNERLSVRSRVRAGAIYSSLKRVRARVHAGGHVSVADAVAMVKQDLQHGELECAVEYVAVESGLGESLCEGEEVARGHVLSVAVGVDGVRLIDNVVL